MSKSHPRRIPEAKLDCRIFLDNIIEGVYLQTRAFTVQISSEKGIQMVSSADIKGIIATPFKENEDLDIEGLKKLSRYLIDGGVDGIMVVGGTGEFPHLDREEKKRAIGAMTQKPKCIKNYR